MCRDLGQRVFELRRERHWTQQQLADEMEIDVREIRRVEAGDNVTVHMLVRLATAFSVEVPALFATPKLRRKRRVGRPPSV